MDENVFEIKRKKEKVTIPNNNSTGRKMLVFNESMLRKVDVPEKAKALFQVKEFGRYDIANAMEFDRIKLKKYKYDADGLAMLLKLNSSDATNSKEVIYMGIVLCFLDLGIIPVNKEPEPEPEESADPKVKDFIKDVDFNTLKSLAKIIAIAALHVYVHGLNDINESCIKWFSSFKAVKGAFISEGNARQIFKIIIHLSGFGSLQNIMDMITVDEIRRESKLFKYRFIKLSSPQLVKEALRAFNFECILSYFPFESLCKYIEFEEAGLLGEVAAGTLKEFCNGNVNPLKVKDIAGNMVLSNLEAIEAPYDPVILRRTKVILDKINYNYGNWYQGNKASVGITPEDMFFKALVNKMYDKNYKDVSVSQDNKLES